MLNQSFHYQDGALFCDDVPLSEIAAQVGTPVYVYSLRRALENLRRIQTVFASVNPHIHYSAKANGNLALLKTLVAAGAGIDAVSGGEIRRALLAGAKPEDVVFAGVGKRHDELAYALEQAVGWINVENVAELHLINQLAGGLGRIARVAIRLNPDIAADTHPHIATGHGAAKFGLPAEIIRDLLLRQTEFPHVEIAGIHIHIGSQLHDTAATQTALERALALIQPYPHIRSVNIGGGLPIAYRPDEVVPDWGKFASALTPLLKGYEVLLEPGRSIIADAGALVASVLYTKAQGGQQFLVVDASMTELIRPALYQAHHEIVPVVTSSKTSELATSNYEIVGPVCETTDALGHGVPLPEMQPDDLLAILNVGAYGMAMASNYNQRPRPPEVVVEPDGKTWRIARRRETWDDLLRHEIEVS